MNKATVAHLTRTIALQAEAISTNTLPPDRWGQMARRILANAEALAAQFEEVAA